ncbi:MAG: M23 family metallopeptidase [Candidatus Moraniibacteriota bacterium]
MKIATRFIPVVLCAFSNVVCALDQTETGFFYPIGKSDFATDNGWWLSKDPNYFTNKYHIGVDMMTRSLDGNAYAIADGVIYKRHCSDDSWGPGNCALFIRHRVSDGRLFTSLNGHLSKESLPGNNDVYAGKPIGKTGPWGSGSNGIHLHFGIFWGDVPPATVPDTRGWGMMNVSQWTNPCEGNTQCTNGFVNPVDFIKTNKPASSTCLGSVCGDAVVYHGKLRVAQTVRFGTEMISVTDVGWFPFVDRCTDAKQYFYMTKLLNPASSKFNAVPAPSSICADVVPACFAQ